MRRIETQGFVFQLEETPRNLTVHAFKDGVFAGEATFVKESFGWVVGNIHVVSGSRGQKLGTEIYKVAASEACANNTTLFSGVLRSPFAEAFWRKQAGKGVAYCAQPNREKSPNFYDKPWRDLVSDVQKQCVVGDEQQRKQCVKERLKPFKARVPLPERNDDQEEYWPCRLYALQRCAARLEGVPTRRSKRRARR